VSVEWRHTVEVASLILSRTGRFFVSGDTAHAGENLDRNRIGRADVGGSSGRRPIEKVGIGVRAGVRAGANQDACVSKCQNCWSHCSGKGHSVGYGFYCSRGCRSRTAQCWRPS